MCRLTEEECIRMVEEAREEIYREKRAREGCADRDDVNIVTDPLKYGELLERMELFLKEPEEGCTFLCRQIFTMQSGEAGLKDMLLNEYADIFCTLSGYGAMDVPEIHLDFSKFRDARLKGYSYVFTGDCDTQILLAPVEYNGNRGLSLHRFDWYVEHCGDTSGDEQGFLRADFLAFEGDAAYHKDLHILWNKMEEFYETSRGRQDGFAGFTETNVSGAMP